MLRVKLTLILCLTLFLVTGYVAAAVDATNPSITTTVNPSSEPLISPDIPSDVKKKGDGFNRADSTDMGPKWIEAAGDWRIEGNHARCTPTFSPELMVFNAISGAEEQLVQMEVEYGGSARVTYVGAATGYADLSNNVFVKVQDNDANGNFERIFFYYGNNGSPWPGMTGGDASEDVPAFTSARLSFFYQPALAQVTLDIDGTRYTRGGIPIGALGTESAAVGFDNARIDRLRVFMRNPAAAPSASSLNKLTTTWASIKGQR